VWPFKQPIANQKSSVYEVSLPSVNQFVVERAKANVFCALCVLKFNTLKLYWFWKSRPKQALIVWSVRVEVGTTSVVIRKNWNDTEKISMAPAQG